MNHKREEIRIRPDDVLKMIKLKLQNKSDYRIAKIMHKPPITVKRCLDRIEEDYPLLKEFIRDVQKTKYFVKDFRDLEVRERVRQSMKERVAQGYWFNRPPIGYDSVNNKLKINPQAERVKLSLEMYVDYETEAQIRKKTGFTGSQLRQIRKHLEIYLGNRFYEGKFYLKTHPAIIDEKLADAVRRVKKKGYLLPYKKLPEWTRKNGDWVKHPKTTAKFAKAVKIFLREKDLTKFVEEMGISDRTAQGRLRIAKARLRNPLYANKRFVDGQLVDADVDEIIKFKTWQRVQSVLRNYRNLMRKKQANKRKYKVLDTLHKFGRTSSKTLSKATGHTKETLSKYLHELREEGLVDKEPGHYGAWHIPGKGEPPVRSRVLGSLPGSTREIREKTGLLMNTILFHLRACRETGEVTLLFDGRYWPVDESVNRLRELVEEKGWRTFTKSKVITRSAGTRDKMLSSLPGDWHEIMERTKLSQTVMFRWLKLLREDTIVEKRNDGKWHITREATEFINMIRSMLKSHVHPV